MKKKSSGKRSVKRILLTILCVILSLALVVLLAAVIIGKSMLGKINRFDDTQPTLSSSEIEQILQQTDPPDPTFTGPVLRPEDVTIPTSPTEIVTDKENIINFLLVGQDRREGEPRQRSDSMILITVNKSEKTLTMTSFLRDIWLTIPGYYDQRLNVPYVVGGFDLLNATLERNFGISSDNNIEVDFNGFKDIIDSVGGVDIELTDAEARHLNSGSESEKDGGWNLVEGVQHLNGKQALEYSRIRVIGMDFGRTNRQRTVLLSLFNKFKSLSWLELYPVLNKILPMVTTDMTDEEILKYAKELVVILPELKIVSQRIPVDDYYYFANVQGNDVILLGEQGTRKAIEMIRQTVGEE